MKDPAVLLKHICESIEKLEEYSAGKTFADFESNTGFQDAVMRRLQIIGEAAKNLPESFKSKHAGIDWKEAAAMRDILTHQYFTVDLKVVWETVQRDIPALKKGVSALLKEMQS